ncbi:LacI family DNA-binding transcriptional regulator [Lutimonas zeaxanthinifaciens]|uniref:LacI family DNA-binding transcriptional regulator n=1 Tax=Lutimonas zeaxanthinifaciens TaxID=3060215 RepID=UPI00265D4BA3|nr:LacI family DNA-binding transcriptional regulator [Lutimonas sp. YSD2104]WKK65589.1 LacI family DNA-binding transcriptional regulator [Lutimonas sp. YSD2104]
MRNKKITLKELASILKVSVSTVSKALNDSYEISEATKKKVKTAAIKYNYSPNLLAQGLKTRRTKIIGVVIPDMRAPFFIRVLRGIEKEASEKGYNILTCFSNESFEKEKATLEMLSQGNVDGILMSLSKETQEQGQIDHVNEIMSNGIPVTLFDRVDDRIECDKVIINDFESTYFATRELLKAGARNILFISPISTTTIGKNRYRGYAFALREKGNLEEKVLSIEEYKDFSADLNRILSTEKVDGIIAANELTGISAVNIASRHGLKVPEDISIIGFTNGLLSMNSNPPLTTMSQHGKEIGRVATNKLLNRLNNTKLEYTTTVIETTLIKRGTTRH